MSVDNPYYFNTELPAHFMSPTNTIRHPQHPHHQHHAAAVPPPVPEPRRSSGSGGGGFSFFRRRSSSSSSGCAAHAKSPTPIAVGQSPKSSKAKTFNSATLGAEAAILGSRRSSLSSLFRPQPVAPVPAAGYYSFGPASLPMNGAMYVDPRPDFGRPPPQARLGGRMHPQQQQPMPQCRTRHESYGDTDEVFLQSGPASLNASQSGHYPADGLRRHSIGTAIRNGGAGGGDRVRCGSLTDEVPKSYAPRPPVTSASASSSPKSQHPSHHQQQFQQHHPHLQRHGRRPSPAHQQQLGQSTAATSSAATGGYCFNSNSSASNAAALGGGQQVHDDMDDILIVTARQSEPAILWANYLRTRFDKITKQRGRKPFNFLHIKIDEEPITADLSRRCNTTKLQIVILCPALVALPEHFLQSQLSVCLRPDIVLGILLEVPEERIAAIHRQALPAYRRWRRCVVPSAAASHGHPHHDQSQSLHMAKVLGIATDILGRALCQRPLCNTAVSPTVATDKLHTMLGIQQQAQQQQQQQQMSTSQTGSAHEAFTVLPRKVKVGQSKVVALLSEPLAREDSIRVVIEKTGEQIEAAGLKRRNPYTLQFSVPDVCMEVSTMIEVRIIRNGRELGRRPVKCESRLRELEQLLRAQDQPMEFMCQAMGVGHAVQDVAALDGQLVQAFQRNMPAGYHLLAGKAETGVGGCNGSAQSEEFPTLLHFAARWGLEQLAVQLMECPGGEAAAELRNIAGKTPAEMAEVAGHTKLSTSLRSFAQMNELSTMYQYFKGISTDASAEAAVNVQLAAIRKPSTSATIRSEEYMEMNASEAGAEDACSVNAVTNLNYINIDSIKDEEIARNLNDAQTESPSDVVDSKTLVAENSATLSDTGSARCTELRIAEPAYYDSQEINQKVADPFSQDCLNVLENCGSGSPRSGSSMSSASSTPPKSVSSSDKPSNAAVGDYMLHPSNIPVLPDKQATETEAPIDFGDYLMQPSNRPVDAPVELAALNSLPANTKTNTLSRQESNVSKASAASAATGVDEELLEIMNDFKNNVFTIAEVEQLVDSWRSRNDVRQSYKDKQAQLARMREEYERVQAAMRDKMKHRPSAFERMRKLFSRSKQQQQPTPSASDDSATEESAANGKSRPRSSLSLQSLSSSTSSSGRLSTGSACSGTSLGDSGTHSDPEERRSAACRIGHPGSLLSSSHSTDDNYMMPPAPRPVSTQSLCTPTTPDTPQGSRYFGTTPPQKPTTLQLQPSASASSFADCSENYTMFPSNVPVFPSPTSPLSPGAMSLGGAGHHLHDYMNFSGLNTIEEAKETSATATTSSATPSSDVQAIKIRTPDECYTSCGSLNSGNLAAVKRTTFGGGAATGGQSGSGDLCSSFKTPPPPAMAVAVASADGQTVRFQKAGAGGGGSVDGLDRRTHESLAQLTRSIDGCSASMGSMAAVAAAGPTSSAVTPMRTATVSKAAKLCKSSSSPSVGVFGVVAASGAHGDQHDYMNV